MLNKLQSITSQFEQKLTIGLDTSINSIELLSHLTSFYDDSKTPYQKRILQNYTKTHATTTVQGNLIQGAIDSLDQ